MKGKFYYVLSYKYAHRDSIQAPKPFLTIPNDVQCSIDIVGTVKDEVILHTDYKAKNFCVLKQDINKVNQPSVLIPERDIPLISVEQLENYLVCLYLKKGQQVCYVYDLSGKLKMFLEFPAGCSTSYYWNNPKEPDFIYYELKSFYHKNTFKMDLKKLTSDPIHKLEVKYNPEGIESKVVFYKSKDGTEIPMYLTYKKDIKQDKNRPALLYAYGGFGIALTPFFHPNNILWIENGGILAVPNIRGGGELGSEWHKQGSGLNKQNSFDDFIYAAKYLIDNNYSQPGKMVIKGGSNGGLLVAAAMCQAPELFKVVIAENGVYDMLRYHNFTVGQKVSNEYGTSRDEENFNNLFSYSPLHNLKKGVTYPATLVVTGDNDDRVSPLHSYKFLATLQEKGDGKNPYFLHILPKTGHGNPELLKEYYSNEAFIFQFIFDQIGQEIKMK